jgi:conjugal transfer pilus assembly protein TraW
MKDIIREKTRTGEVAKFWNNYRDQSIADIKYPAPLGIPTNYAFSTQLRDLKFVITQDYKDQNGIVIAHKGTVVEPLKVNPLTVGLIFIDGRDQAQVDYAIREGRKQPLKIVLTAGSAFDLRVKYKDQPWGGSKTIPFYFDQKKMIINQFAKLYQIDINRMPTKLFQQGTQLRIEYGIKS